MSLSFTRTLTESALVASIGIVAMRTVTVASSAFVFMKDMAGRAVELLTIHLVVAHPVTEEALDAIWTDFIGRHEANLTKTITVVKKILTNYTFLL